MQNYARLLKENPEFRKLWIAQVISLTGDWFSTIVLSVLVVAYSPGNEGLAISGLLMARFIPPMLISPIAGVLVDRFDRRNLLIFSNVMRVFVVLGFLPTTQNPDLLWLIYLLSIMQFILSAIFEPGQSAIIPSLIPFRELILANTLVSVTWSVMLALGAVLGGIVTTLLGAQVALIIDALTFVLAAVLLWRINVPERQDDIQLDASLNAEDKSFNEGLRFIRKTPAVGAALFIKFGSSLGNVDTLMTIFATQIFVFTITMGGQEYGADGQLALGIMYSAFGLGAILGPLLMNRFSDGRVLTLRRLIIIAFIWIALGWILLGTAGTLLVFCLGLIVRAMGGSVNWTYSAVILQKSTPDAYLGRIFSIDMALYYMATVASTLVHGSLIDLIGAQDVRQVALWTTVVGFLAFAAWVIIVRWLEYHQLVTGKVALTGD